MLFAQKVIRLRKRLIKSGKSKKNASLMFRLIKKHEIFLEAHSSISYQNLKGYLLRHESDFKALIPPHSPLQQRYDELVEATPSSAN